MDPDPTWFRTRDRIIMELVKRLLVKYTTPADLDIRSGILYWQERVLLTLLLICTTLGFLVYIPSITLAVKEDLWIIVILDTVIYAGILVLFIGRKLPYRLRAKCSVLLSYSTGMVLIMVLGPFGAGPVWLFAFPVLAGLLLDTRASWLSLGLNLLTLVTIGLVLMSGQLMPWHYPEVANPIEKWSVSSLNFMLLDTVVALSVSTVIQGLRKSHEALKTSEASLRRIFDNILDVYYEATLDGTITNISPSVEQISGYSRHEMIHKSLYTLYDNPHQRTRLIDNIRRMGKISGAEINLKDKDGSIVICAISARLMADDTGNPIGIVGSLRDVSAQKAMEAANRDLEERLNRSNKMEAIGLLAGGVAHDLNNILSGIVGYPDLMLMDLPESSPLRAPLRAIQESGQRAADIVQDLLTLSRRGVVTRDVINLNEIVTHFFSTPEFEKIQSIHPEVIFLREIRSETPFVLGSQTHLTKTLMNLIINGAEAQPDGGTLRVSTGDASINETIPGYDHVTPGEYVILTVQDNGLGIEPQDLKRIFEPFFTRKAMGRSGSGLGMAVVWGTVQDHNGYIDIKSQPGKGTTVTIYLPRTDLEPFSKAEPEDIKDYMGNRETVLVVDDLKFQRDIATAMLEKLGYSPVSVSSGEEAVTYLATHSADLILLDMIMDPGMDGLETYKQIISRHPGQRTLIISGFSETDKVREAIRLGAAGYIKKPCSLIKLGVTVASSLNPVTSHRTLKEAPGHGPVLPA
ncbi:MAG: ATP-binding protein [Pseudomonadota bacterium]